MDNVRLPDNSGQVKVFAVEVESVEPLCCGEYTVTTVLHFACDTEDQARELANKYIEKNEISFTYATIVSVSAADGVPDDTIHSCRDSSSPQRD